MPAIDFRGALAAAPRRVAASRWMLTASTLPVLTGAVLFLHHHGGYRPVK